MAGIGDPSLLNSEVKGFEEKVEDAIPTEVRYACWYWTAPQSYSFGGLVRQKCNRGVSS